MKNIFFQLFFIMIITNVHAFSLSDALDKIEDKAKNSVKDEGMVSLDNLLNSLKEEANSKIAKIEDKINAEIDKVTNEVKTNIAEYNKIKKKAEFYLELFKILAVILSSSILLIIFFVFKLYRRVSKLLHIFENIKNYKDIEKRLSVLEALQVKKIKGA
jgi:predicted PurR-regulated permease PerM